MHGYLHLCLLYLHVNNVYFNYVVIPSIDKLMDFIPIIALICMDIDIFANIVSMLLMFTLTYLYFLE